MTTLGTTPMTREEIVDRLLDLHVEDGAKVVLRGGSGPVTDVYEDGGEIVFYSDVSARG